MKDELNNKYIADIAIEIEFAKIQKNESLIAKK